MSGHSKWANIRVKKTAEDKKRSAIFTKMAKLILVAVKMGGGTNVNQNSQLKAIIDRAKQVNMPKDSIERVLQRFDKSGSNMVNYLLEGFVPGGVYLITEVETDNKIRTANQVRLILEKHGGGLGSNNSAMHLFDRMGRIEVDGQINDHLWEKLVEMGALDIVDNFVYVGFEDLGKFMLGLHNDKIAVADSGLYLRAKARMEVDEVMAEQVENMIEDIKEIDEVVDVFTNLASHNVQKD